MTTSTFRAQAQEKPADPPEAAKDAPADEGLTSNEKGAIIGFSATALLFGSSLLAYRRAASANDNPGFEAYRDSVPAGYDVCDMADRGFVAGPGADSPEQVRAECDKASDWRTAGHVLAVGGVAALGVRIAALLWPEPEKKEAKAVRIAPVVSEGGGAVQVDVTF